MSLEACSRSSSSIPPSPVPIAVPSSAETRASAVFALTDSAPNDMCETKNGTSRTNGRSAR